MQRTSSRLFHLNTLVLALTLALAVQPSVAETTADNSALESTPIQQPITLGGASGVQAELEDLYKYRDELLEPDWEKKLLSPWFDWKQDFADRTGIKMGVNLLMTYQDASEAPSPGDDSDAAGGIYRFQGSWTAFQGDNGSVGKLDWRLEARGDIGTDLAPQELGGQYMAALNPGFPYGNNFDTDFSVLSWTQAFNKGRWGYAAGRMAFDVHLDSFAFQSPYRGFLNRAFILNPSIGTTGLGALGAAVKGHVSDQLWIGAQIYDGNAANGEFDFDTVQEGEWLKAVELGWTPGFARRATDRIQLTYWEKDERKKAGVSAGSGWAMSSSYQLTPDVLGFFRAGQSDGGAGVAAESSANLGFELTPWAQRAWSLGVGWSEPSEETHGTGLKDEWVIETSYKMQLTRALSITPDIQWLKNPARLPTKDQLWIFGIRAIITL